MIIDMPQIVSGGVSARRSGNYSNCPLKKRPIKYDLMDESDSDISRNDSPPIAMDVSEPENLSTKPEDLRLTSKSVQVSSSPTPLRSPLTTQPTVPSPHYYVHPMYPHGLTPPYSPDSSYIPLPEPPLLTKYTPPSGGPLEPISLNPPAVWSRISHPYSAFHLASTSARSQTSNTSHHYSRHQNEERIAYPISYPKIPSSGVIRVQPSQYLSPSHFAPFINSRGESDSPPHVSPPLKSEPSYPQEIQRVMALSRSPIENHPMTNVRTSVTNCPTAKHDVSSHILTRESIISHTQGHSCSSGVSSPSSSSSSCGSERSSSNGLPPMATQTNGGSVRYQCPDCNKSYSTYSGLTKHIQFHCSSQNKKSFICKFCEKVYVSLGALKMHIRTHTLPCKCNECGKAFSRPWLLQGHIRTHTGEKPFTCQHCNRAFADRSNLRAHLQTHSEVKKYSCKTCGKTFSRMSLLVKHEDSGCSSTLSN